MCLNKRYITNYYGRSILVKCGHCPACLQEKAISRVNKIHANNKKDYIPLFCTFTYQNKFVPYFDLDELLTTKVWHINEIPDRNGGSHLDPTFVHSDSKRIPGFTQFKEVSIYRDSSHRFVRKNKDYKLKRKIVSDRELLDTIVLPYPLCDTEAYKFLQNKRTHIGQAPHVGVCYYKDAQDFVKRLRRYLSYRNYDKTFSYYICSEYGPATCRPHFHALFFVPYSDVFFWKCALSKAWSFDDGRQAFRNIQIAKKAAAYVSSYVNCDSSVPEVFKIVKALKPCHHTSQGFGLALQSFTLPAILKAFERRDLRYVRDRVKKGTLIMDNLLYPEYVLRRYFPKIKGFSRLSTDALQFISTRPQNLEYYASQLDYSTEDLTNNIKLLTSKKSLCASLGLSPFDYPFVYSQIWSVRASNMMEDFYKTIVQPPDNYYAYDNIADYLITGYGSESFDQLNFCKPYAGFILDPNDFPLNRSKHYALLQSYESYSKDRKIRNRIYSQTPNFNV